MKDEQNLQIYSSNELSIVENAITSIFGEYQNVFHEIASFDVHLDVYIIEPNNERDYYTLVTCGCGAHSMNIPEEYNHIPKNAEYLVKLPKDWIFDNEPENYWPIEMLKEVGRLALNNDTFVAHYHTIGHHGTYDESVGFCGCLLSIPEELNQVPIINIAEEKPLIFYELIPLYHEEIDYKIKHGVDNLLDKMGEFDLVVDINRKSAL